jgi:hypothetical protein
LVTQRSKPAPRFPKPLLVNAISGGFFVAAFCWVIAGQHASLICIVIGRPVDFFRHVRRFARHCPSAMLGIFSG